MSDVIDLQQRRRELARLARIDLPADMAHMTGVRVGTFGSAMQCQTCGTICLAQHGPMTLTDTDTGRTWTIAGAWIGPPGDPHRHFFPFGAPAPQQDQDDTDQQSATEPAPRPAGISAAAAAKGRTRDTPSRSPEARHDEYVRGKRREAQRV